MNTRNKQQAGFAITALVIGILVVAAGATTYVAVKRNQEAPKSGNLGTEHVESIDDQQTQEAAVPLAGERSQGNTNTGVIPTEEEVVSVGGTSDPVEPANPIKPLPPKDGDDGEGGVPQPIALRECPEIKVQNRMPMIGEGNRANSYFILDGNRRELAEFDLDWVEGSCEVKTEVVY